VTATQRVTADEVVSTPRYRAAIERLAAETGRDAGAIDAEARVGLEELATGHGRLVHGLLVRAGRALCRRGYERIDVDPVQVERIREAFATSPAAVLSSHRSYLDGAALTAAFDDAGLPRTFEFVGINLAFWPMGPLWRRMGGILIRRRAAEPVYRVALRAFLGRLAERRLPLRWFIEGTRSRTGKLAPPKLGLLAWVVEASREAGGDLLLVPASVSYDQLHEVEEFADEAQGAAKRAESLGWLVRYVRAQRGRFGNIHVRFGEPLSVREALGAAGPETVPADVGLARLALEVSWRITQATPITGVALVAVALLGARGVPLSMTQLRVALRGYLTHARRRALPLATAADITQPALLQRHLDALVGRGVAMRLGAVASPRFGTAPGGHLKASYYRNSLVHHYLTGAIAELALLAAAEAPAPERAARFEAEALALRDLLKFEFFFQDKDAFVGALEAEARRLDTHWPAALAAGGAGARGVLESADMLASDMMLRSFLAAYAIVAQALVDLGHDAAPDEDALVAACENVGRLALEAGRLSTPESVSRMLFRNGLLLARHRGLLETAPDVPSGREALAAELRRWLGLMDEVHAIAVRRVRVLVAAEPG
jgi:glycerol-3-phosphate O-acyltransferase